MKRRQFLAATFVGSAGVFVGGTPIAALPGPIGEEHSSATLIDELARRLRRIGTPHCLQAAADLNDLPAHTRDFDLHLRRAGIDSEGVSIIADAFRSVRQQELGALRSFSLSYNHAVGDEGAIALAAALPSAVRVVGLVGCGIGDQGGHAMLEWAAEADGLVMLCIENNHFSDNIKSQFRELSRVSVYI